MLLNEKPLDDRSVAFISLLFAIFFGVAIMTWKKHDLPQEQRATVELTRPA